MALRPRLATGLPLSRMKRQFCTDLFRREKCSFSSRSRGHPPNCFDTTVGRMGDAVKFGQGISLFLLRLASCFCAKRGPAFSPGGAADNNLANGSAVGGESTTAAARQLRGAGTAGACNPGAGVPDPEPGLPGAGHPGGHSVPAADGARPRPGHSRRSPADRRYARLAPATALVGAPVFHLNAVQKPKYSGPAPARLRVPSRRTRRSSPKANFQATEFGPALSTPANDRLANDGISS